MQMSSEREIAAPPEEVWAAILDPEVLQACVPGCQDMSGNADDGFETYFHGFGGSTLVVDILYQVLLECTNNNFRRRLLSEQNNGNRYMSVLEILP